jgi:hypothetical protein
MAKKAKAKSARKASARKPQSSARAREPESISQNWEYHTIAVSRSMDAAGINQILNELGGQGWELASSIPEEDTTFLVLKRQRP